MMPEWRREQHDCGQVRPRAKLAVPADPGVPTVRVPAPARDDHAPDARVVVADGNALSRRGLAAVLRDSGYQVVGEATTATWALQVVQAKRPDALIAAADLPHADPGTGPADRSWLVSAARECLPDLAIIVLGPARSDETLFRAAAAGASGYTSRSAMPAAILAILAQALAAPRAFVADDLMAAQRRRARSRTPRLSARESQILQLLAQGMTVPAVAQQLYLAESTVKSHVSRIYVKLGVGNRSQAIMAAVSMGLVPNPGARPR